MSKKQTRRSISVRGTTYEALRQYCAAHDRSMSDLVEEKLAALLGEAPAPAAHVPARPRTIAAKILRAPAQKAEGRPAPTPAREVVSERVSAPKGDYRVIRF